VTDTIRVKNSPAMRLVPILRPLVPQFGHLVADKCSNTLVLVDTYANVRRLEAIVQRLDVGEPYKLPPCDAQEMNQPREPGK
jgi:general secretion pathway protein D